MAEEKEIFGFKAQAELFFTEDESGKNKHHSTKILLDVSDNLEGENYIGEDGQPTHYGAKIMNETFIHGLVASMDCLINVHGSKRSQVKAKVSKMIDKYLDRPKEEIRENEEPEK